MSKSKKTKAKATQAEANFKAAAKKASAKIREKAKDLILPPTPEEEAAASVAAGAESPAVEAATTGEEMQAPADTAPSVEEAPASAGNTVTEEAKPKINKKKLMLDMLKRPEGASIDELIKATGWQKHSVRGSLVNLKNKDKHPITNSKDEDGPRRYFLKSDEAPQAPVSQPEPEGDTTPAPEAPANEEAA